MRTLGSERGSERSFFTNGGEQTCPSDPDPKLLVSAKEALDDLLREQPEIWSRMTHSTRTSEVLAESDYSYRNRRLTGDRWLLAGDAAGFIDPMFSTGVFVAMETAEQAADAVAEALQDERRRAAAFRKYERETNRVMDLYLRFVGNWYKPKFIEVMTHPVNRFQLAPVINSMLLSSGRSKAASRCGRECRFFIW